MRINALLLSTLALIGLMFLSACSSTSVPTDTPTPVPTDTPTSIPTNTPTSIPTNTPTPVPTDTPTPVPTNTPTPIPLSEIDLEAILIQPGDLPAGYSGAQVKSLLSGMIAGISFDELPKPENGIDQRFQKDGKTAGGVSVLLYESPDNLETSHQMISDGMLDEEFLEKLIKEFGSTSRGIAFSSPDDLGDKAYAVGTYTILNDQDDPLLQALTRDTANDDVSVLFQRCSALIFIHFGDYGYVSDERIAAIHRDEGIAYAQRLDNRLTPLVCR